jgi:hypothetical protein
MDRNIFRFTNDVKDCPTFERIGENAFLLFKNGEIVPRSIDCKREI